MINNSGIQKEDEIDLIELLQTVWSKRKTIFKFVIIFGLIGLFVAVFSEKEYTAQTIVIPQTSSSKVGSLGGLAAMAGINIGEGSGEGISPSLYPKIVSSIPFKKALLETLLDIDGVTEKVTYQDYFEKYYTPSLLSYIKKYSIGLPGVILSLFKNKDIKESALYTKDSIYKISSVDDKLFKQIDQQLKVEVLDNEGIVNISYIMPEALAAAQMTKTSQKLLQDAIIRFKIKKIKGEVDFIQQRYNEVKKDFIKRQGALASFKDRHQGLIMARSQTRQDRLEAEYNLSYGIYSELAKQLETQKIKLKENTPVFTIIEPVSVPIRKSKPKKVIILAIWLFLGVVVGILVVLGRGFIKNLKTVKNEL